MKRLLPILLISLVLVTIIILIFARCSGSPETIPTSTTEQSSEATAHTPSSNPTKPSASPTKPNTNPTIPSTKPTEPIENTEPTEPEVPTVFTFTIDGVECYFGMRFADILARFELAPDYDASTMQIGAGKEQAVDILNGKGNRITIGLYNNTDCPLKLRHCTVYSIDISKYAAEGFFFSPTTESISFTSSIDEIIDVLGEWTIEKELYGPNRAYVWLRAKSTGDGIVSIVINYNTQQDSVDNICLGIATLWFG